MELTFNQTYHQFIMNNELEQFRKNWKEELVKSSSGGDKIYGDDAKTSDGACPDLGQSSSDADGTTTESVSNTKSNECDVHAIKREALSNAANIRDKPNTLEPFLLAERLLEESNSATGSGVVEGRQYGRNRRRTVSDEANSNETKIDSKRRKEITGSTNTKKTNSYLDTFLADLVSDRF